MQPKPIVAIDPGPTESAFCRFGDGMLGVNGKMENKAILELLRGWSMENETDDLIIEWIQGYGLTVGQSVFETCRWVGIYQEAWESVGGTCHLIGRKEVKLFLCGNTTSKDQHVREALIDRLGPVGTKKHPGPLYGVSGDVWSALAAAVTWYEQNHSGNTQHTNNDGRI